MNKMFKNVKLIILMLIINNLAKNCFNAEKNSVRASQKLTNCKNEISGKITGHLYISTLDGKLTALDLYTGKLEWVTDTGPGPLLSSSIQNIELKSDGNLIRLIPALSGSIYKFDGEYISKTSFTAENLISSFKISDNLIMSGGNEIRSYGISHRTGQILYECSMHGCLNNTYQSETPYASSLKYIADQHNTYPNEIVVVKRKTQIVRALEPRSGQERWNFSVGYHELEFLDSENCNALHNINTELLNLQVKVTVKDNISIIFAFLKGNPNIVVWKYKMKTPIANVWMADFNKKLEILDAIYLSDYVWNVDFKKYEEQKNLVFQLIYVGTYNNQLYVQESNYYEGMVNQFLHSSSDELADHFVKLVTATQEKLQMITMYNVSDNYDEQCNNLNMQGYNTNENVENTTALSIFHSPKFINEQIFNIYVLNEINGSLKGLCNNEHFNKNQTEYSPVIDVQNTPVEIIIISIWFWWKEIVVISSTTALIINLYLPKLNKERKILVIERRIHIPPQVQDVENYSTPSYKKNQSKDFKYNSRHKAEIEFISRFHLDFEIISCIGRGGFGIVFEAKNKLDGCNYAVKKILLPNKIEKRNRVMREVKTLANCEHHNIVRYFQAWIESSPPNMQKVCEYENFDSVSVEDEFTNEMENHSQNLILNNNQYSFSQSDVQSVISISECEFTVSKQEEIKANKQISVSTSYDKSFQKKSSKLNINLKKAIEKSCSLFERRNSISTNADTLLEHDRNKVYLYIQMQLCRKESLRDWLSEHLPETRVPSIHKFFEQILDAVNYVHEKGLIHRDLKPSNIFFSQNGQIKIGDFGLVTLMTNATGSKIYYENMNCDSTPNNSNYKHTEQVGTYLYMSPEQLKGEPYDYKVDIYSLGLIFFEMLVYFPTEMERIVTLTELRNGKFSSTFQKHFPEELVLLKQMLSNKPKTRPNSLEIKKSLLNIPSWTNSQPKTQNEAKKNCFPKSL